MTGIADLYLYVKRPYSKDRRKRLLAHLLPKDSQTRFVVLSWKRTGSNLLCGILHNHPEIIMHNELFNPIDIFTYHPAVFQRGLQWTVLTRDIFPEDFLEFVWTGNHPTLPDGSEKRPIKTGAKAVGFKSFPEHWTDVRNEEVWRECILNDLRVKKIVLHRQDELAVLVSMIRADETGRYLQHAYPKDLKITIDPARLQSFVDSYRDTFQRKYKSPLCGRDTFLLTYEQLVDQERFEKEMLPLLWKFLGVDPTVPLKTLRETVKQADPDEDISSVIENYNELEFCFRHSNLSHFDMPCVKIYAFKLSKKNRHCKNCNKYQVNPHAATNSTHATFHHAITCTCY